MEPGEEKTLRFFLGSEGFQAGKSILFLFSNDPCGQSSEYHVQLRWGPHQSGKVPVPCVDNVYIAAKYFTEFGGGNVELEVIFTGGNNPVRGAGVRILHGEEGERFPW
ncbi:MAG: hypothetical protein BECKG1743D_GA0114223_102854 [Candidatus Kentron sp. G]|nr:MAG: hypothetical protein BECKG1743E_GA0114224_103114 [Candidatus Kentron sp. G]VFN01487.1 MAG: hypothetical protein BECKG1743D_GA0114223_102854 [Candidatus Kentron sp. G]